MKTASSWHSERIDQEIRLVRWGTWGVPVLVFPTAGGDAEEIERMQLIGALAPLIDGGRIKVYSCDNLAGRALLDKGEYRAAAEALLANYRSNPQGERAADSLFYLGQASFKLRQPQQACRAYAELENVYGSALRTELRRLLPAAKAEANCS